MGIHEVFRDHQRTLSASAESLPSALEAALEALVACLDQGGLVMACGNGGSAADAQHLVSELVGRVRHDRRPLRAVALSTDGSTLTAIANDYGYDQAFARQVRALARPGDVLVAISTSGGSPNVVEAAKAAKAADCRVVALTGPGGGRLAEAADVLVPVPANDVARIQEMHGLSIHALCEAIEDDLLAARTDPR